MNSNLNFCPNIQKFGKCKFCKEGTCTTKKNPINTDTSNNKNETTRNLIQQSSLDNNKKAEVKDEIFEKKKQMTLLTENNPVSINSGKSKSYFNEVLKNKTNDTKKTKESVSNSESFLHKEEPQITKAEIPKTCRICPNQYKYGNCKFCDNNKCTATKIDACFNIINNKSCRFCERGTCINVPVTDTICINIANSGSCHFCGLGNCTKPKTKIIS